MVVKGIPWDAVAKNGILLVKLAEHHFNTCHTEGKTSSAVRGLGTGRDPQRMPKAPARKANGRAITFETS